MSVLRRRGLAWLFCSCCVWPLVSGCGPKLVPVEGTVTLNDKPLPKASVVFIPKDANKGEGAPREATGFTDENGKFSLISPKNTGIFPGLYKVIVSKRIPNDATPTTVNAAPAGQPFDPSKLASVGGSFVNSKELLPEEYTNPAQTTLEVGVPAGGKTDVELKLTMP